MTTATFYPQFATKQQLRDALDLFGLRLRGNAAIPTVAGFMYRRNVAMFVRPGEHLQPREQDKILSTLDNLRDSKNLLQSIGGVPKKVVKAVKRQERREDWAQAIAEIARGFTRMRKETKTAVHKFMQKNF